MYLLSYAIKYYIENVFSAVKKYTISAFTSKATQLTRSIGKNAEYEQKITQVSQVGTEIWFGILTSLLETKTLPITLTSTVLELFPASFFAKIV